MFINRLLRNASHLYSKLINPELSSYKLELCRRNILYYSIGKYSSSILDIYMYALTIMFIVPCLFNILNQSALYVNNDAYPLQISFLKDYGALIFLVLLYPIHTIIIIKLWHKISDTFTNLTENTLISISEIEKKEIINKYNNIFNSRSLNFLVLLIAIGLTYWIYEYGRINVKWWGNENYGILGFFSYVYASMVIWYQLFQHNIKGIISLFLMRDVFHLSTFEFYPQLFHKDRFYGLGNFENIFALIYSTTIIHFLSVLTLLEFHFINKKIDFMTIFIGIIFVLFIPLFIIYPFYKISHLIKSFKDKELDQIQHLLMTNYFNIGNRTVSNLHTMKIKEVQTLDTLIELHNTYDSMKTYPFSKYKFLIMLIIYLAQVSLLTAKFYVLYNAKGI